MLIRTLLLTLLAALAACSSPSGGSAQADLPQAQPDMGLVLFFRKASMKGKAIRFEITDTAEGSIGQLSSGTYIERDLAPGSHTFTARAPSLDGQDSITLKVEAGEVYYVEGEILWGFPTGRPKFKRTNAGLAGAALAKM